MDKNKLLQIKKRLLALGLAGIMMGTTGCSYEENHQSDSGENGVLDRVYITIDEFYKQYKTKKISTFIGYFLDFLFQTCYIFVTDAHRLFCVQKNMKAEGSP